MKCVFLFCTIIALGAAAAQDRTGEAIFKNECARCHGKAGEGTKSASKPLIGEKSPAQLASVIAKTMPDDDPGTLKGDAARKVAEYIHDAFYSPDARAKLNPPRIELGRLTVRQYRNAVADLIGGFGKPAKEDERHGLQGKYFNSRGLGGQRNPLLDRIDPMIQFNFGTDSPTGPEPAPPAPPANFVGPPPPLPEPKGFNPKQFCIAWEGSVFAPESGTYEFAVRSEHGVQLWVNDLATKRPLVDAGVRSGGDEQQLRASINLLGGRRYSLRLEFCKSKELEKKHLEDPKRTSRKASVALFWKTPHGNDEIVPSAYLSPARAPEWLLLNTPFPPDDRSYGWERGTTVSREWNAATTGAALEAAGFVALRLPALAGCALDAPDAKDKLRAFAKTFVERAFRRPLTEDEKLAFVDRHFNDAPDLEQAVKRVVLLVLKSPRFLYPGAMDGQYAVASRLSLSLWDAPPDAQLLDAAAKNKLSTRDEIATQAGRMLNSPLARVKLREFLFTWLRVDRLDDLNKDMQRFPKFDTALKSDLRKSLELFLDDVVWSDTSDFRQLLLSDQTYLNGRLAQFYSVEPPAGGGFARVKWEIGKRSGVLTHPYILAGLAYPGESSPIHRGVFVVRGLLGQTLQPPPDAVAPEPPEMHPGLTTRERVALQTKSTACVQCHALINPLGFALENFDSVGRFREKENTKKIDVSGKFENRDGKTVSFKGARELSALLVKDEQVHAAFIQQLFQHLAKQPVRAYGLDKPKELQQLFAKSNFSVRKIVVEIATLAAETDGKARETPLTVR